MNREGSVAQARECSVSTDIHFLVVGSMMPVYIYIYIHIYIYRSTKLGSYHIYSVVFFFLYN